MKHGCQRRIGVSLSTAPPTSSMPFLYPRVMIIDRQSSAGQNLSLLALEPEDRGIPTMDNVMHDCFDRIGGICYVLSAFTNSLLLTLGYESSLVLCSCLLVTSPNTHVSTIVKNVVNDGDLYFAEVGSSFPTFQPIPIHNLPQEYSNAFLRYKFVKEENMVVRYHASEKDKTCEWHKYYQFEPVPRDEKCLRQFQYPVYTKVGHADAWYLTGLRMTLYPQDKAITLNNYTLKLWSKGENMQTIEIKDKQELEQTILKYFPMMKNINVHKALSRMVL